MNYASISFSSVLVLLTVGCGGGSDGTASNNDTSNTGTTTASGGATMMTTGGASSTASSTDTSGSATMTNTDGAMANTSSGGATSSGTTSSGTTAAPMGCPAAGDTILASEATNYRFSSVVTFPSMTYVAPDTELSFEWGSLTQDFLGHGMDTASEVQMLFVMLWTLTEEELETKLNDDDLLSRDLAILAQFDAAGVTTGNLFSFTSFEMPLDPDTEILPFMDADAYPAESNTYTIMAATGTEPGQGTRMIQAFKLDPNSTNTSVVLTDESTALEYTVDLMTPQKTPIPMGNADFTFDWEGMATNGLGNEFLEGSVNKIVVARFDQTVEELQANFIDLIDYSGEIVAADELYSGNVPAGSTATLSTLMDESGAFFQGIDGNGTWVVGLFCGTCQNPAPWYMSVLESCQ